MKFISTRTHGVLDYSMGLFLIVAPWLLGFAAGGPETWVPVVLGVAALVYSLFTDYELGVVRAIPMTGHLLLDGMSGLLLAASPWIFGFASIVFWPHLILGVLEIGASLFTRHEPTHHISYHGQPITH